MKTAVLFSIPMTTSDEVRWRWRSADGAADSARGFDDYYDCFEDAQAHGYCIEPALQRADLAPVKRPLHAAHR